MPNTRPGRCLLPCWPSADADVVVGRIGRQGSRHRRTRFDCAATLAGKVDIAKCESATQQPMLTVKFRTHSGRSFQLLSARHRQLTSSVSYPHEGASISCEGNMQEIQQKGIRSRSSSASPMRSFDRVRRLASQNEHVEFAIERQFKAVRFRHLDAGAGGADLRFALWARLSLVWPG